MAKEDEAVDAMREGKDARLAELKITTNPHTLGTSERYWWHYGWVYINLSMERAGKMIVLL